MPAETHLRADDLSVLSAPATRPPMRMCAYVHTNTGLLQSPDEDSEYHETRGLEQHHGVREPSQISAFVPHPARFLPVHSRVLLTAA